MREKAKQDVRVALKTSIETLKPSINQLFDDVYENNPDKVPFDFHEILGALAPRGCFSNSPEHDSNFELKGVRQAFARAAEVYTLFNASDHLRLVTPDAGHDFPAAERQAAYQWLDQLLK